MFKFSVSKFNLMIQYPVIQMQRDYYGKPFRVILQNIAGVWVVRDAQTAIIVPAKVNGNTIYFIIATETAKNINVATNDPEVTVVLQDVDFTTGNPVGSAFTVAFNNLLNSQVYVTQTHYVLATVTVKSNTDIVTFYLD